MPNTDDSPPSHWEGLQTLVKSVTLRAKKNITFHLWPLTYLRSLSIHLSEDKNEQLMACSVECTFRPNVTYIELAERWSAAKESLFKDSRTSGVIMKCPGQTEGDTTNIVAIWLDLHNLRDDSWISWNEAQSQCKKINGHLPSVLR